MGGLWSPADLERIREEIRQASPPLRAEVARRVCWLHALTLGPDTLFDLLRHGAVGALGFGAAAWKVAMRDE
ncbi:hypothetical protein [Nitrococcus mobilis]|uniref:Uncharacterized protein n=1 Tax=Nitrococcus mobilis Nb-231 TaxID=314278 RepID=A4BR50_9GAMM|nr:hypothetical protein [Nitrococcus mobilis]EAR22050.1 hypothetical protein NB231_06666 [Nitrococcus mobilis Nb-231]